MKMLHITIRTNRFEEEMRFFLNYVGLKIERDLRPQGRNMVFLANAAGETCIEIIEREEAENAGNEQLSIGFQTEDVEKKREELLADGFEVTPMIRPMPNVKFFFVKDPAGVKIQFI
ncbi:MAG: VOC family protein [Lachnospiraceae bacterium]|nr:VOC family protein [Lachnospiraceae bacterium]